MVKVMIVEDDFMIADTLEETLFDAGYEVCGIVGSVEDAVEMGKMHQPDLAVIDLRLSQGGSGTDVAAALCPGSNVGVLYATGNPNDILLEQAEGQACISKPYTAAAIVMALKIVSEQMAKSKRLSIFPAGFRLLQAGFTA